MNRCTNKNCIFARRFITNGDTRFVTTMLGIAVASYATTTLIVLPIVSLCTFWDRPKVCHVKRMEQVTDHT